MNKKVLEVSMNIGMAVAGDTLVNPKVWGAAIITGGMKAMTDMDPVSGIKAALTMVGAATVLNGVAGTICSYCELSKHAKKTLETSVVDAEIVRIRR